MMNPVVFYLVTTALTLLGLILVYYGCKKGYPEASVPGFFVTILTGIIGWMFIGDCTPVAQVVRYLDQTEMEIRQTNDATILFLDHSNRREVFFDARTYNLIKSGFFRVKYEKYYNAYGIVIGKPTLTVMSISESDKTESNDRAY